MILRCVRKIAIVWRCRLCDVYEIIGLVHGLLIITDYERALIYQDDER